VNVNKLARRFRREALANPKKAAVLGLLVVVALYYWAPLLRGIVSPSKASGDAPAAKVDADTEPEATADVVSAQPPTPPPDKTCPHPWTQLDEWIRQDPTTRAAEHPAGWRDPFTLASARAEAGGREEVQPDQSEVTPTSLGIELSGTLVGSSRRVALVGGKAYREGQTIIIHQHGRPIEFELAEVHLRRIVLARGGKRFDVVIPERETAGRIDASGHPD